MAIGRNLETGITARTKALRLDEGGDEAPPPRTPTQPRTPAAPSTQPAAPPPLSVPPPAVFTTPITAFTPPPPRVTAAAVNPALTATAVNLPPAIFLPNFPLRPDIPVRTATQVAQGALARLRNANAGIVGEAITTVSNKRVAPREMMRYLERKVIIGEVLNMPAAQWATDTRQDFADAFQMVNTKTDVMDAIVALAILNDPDLPEELRDENAADATGADLLENRRVVAQYPPPGTPLEAPYLVLVAVEYRDTHRADEIIQSITGDLVEHQGFRVPRTVAQNLR